MSDKVVIFVPTGDMKTLYLVAQRLLAVPPSEVSTVVHLLASLPPVTAGCLDGLGF